MPLIEHAQNTIHYKLVYYGLPLAGKTATLNALHSRLPLHTRSDLLRIVTETEYTLFFDCTPPELVMPDSMRRRIHVYTIAGMALSDDKRRAILSGADGIVFVVDSRQFRLWENIAFLANMTDYLATYPTKHHLSPTDLVLQYNYRDARDAVPLATLQTALNKGAWTVFETINGSEDTFYTVFLTAVQKMIQRKPPGCDTHDSLSHQTWSQITDALTQHMHTDQVPGVPVSRWQQLQAHGGSLWFGLCLAIITLCMIIMVFRVILHQ